MSYGSAHHVARRTGSVSLHNNWTDWSSLMPSSAHTIVSRVVDLMQNLDSFLKSPVPVSK